MTTRCGLCGYQNNEGYRFCGMCGNALHPPEPPRPPAPPSSPSRQYDPPVHKPLPVTGPSFLGLSQEPEKGGVEYLLEDEEPRSRAGTIIVLLLLAAAAVAAWHWRASYAPLLAKLTPSVSNAPVNGAGAQGSGPSQAVPPVGSGVSTAPTPSQPMASSPAGSSPTTDKQPPPAPSEESHMVVPDDERQTPPAKPAQTEETPAAAAKTPAPQTRNGDEEAPAQNSASADQEDTEAAASVPPARTRKPQAEPVTKPAATSGDDRLVADGQKYLYGDGVPANCDRARRSLTSAAGHNNPQAQSTLGTMYATGHCVTRDLPIAYRWFARALQNEPGNDRVKQDLEVLWRQMNADERQLAMRSQ